MKLSVTEAAQLLGKSDRQIRYLIDQGLPARKEKGHWVIRRQDLPLSKGQEKAARQKTERAAQLAEKILRPEPREAKKGYSVREMRAYQEGAPLYRDVVAAVGAEHPGVGLLREALMLLACGYHEFEGRAKAKLYAGARHHASRAAMALLLDDEDAHRGLVDRLESIVLPALGGLIRQAEKRERGKRQP